MNGLSGLEPVLAAALLYALGLTHMWSRAGVGRIVRRAQALLFGCGIGVLVVALGPPLDTQVSTSLTMHMTQHVLMIWVAAPLLIAGAPVPTMLWVLPDPTRMAWQRRWARVHRNVSGPAWPYWVAAAVAIQSISLLVWHLSAFYSAAVQSPGAHAAEHASFLGAALFFWWTIAGVARRARFGVGVLAIFVAKFAGLVLGVGMAISRTRWYPVYGSGPAALHDQQYAGMVMWVGGGTIATLAALALFATWMQTLERHAPSADPLPRLDEARI